jgi:transcriptional regulator with PAS, ATPase and Fis domain
VQDINPNLVQKVYGKREEETFFEEEPRNSALVKKEENQQGQQEEFEEEEDETNYLLAETVEEEETLSLEAKEIELIKKSLERNKGKRKLAADELGISERTLYRKIKQYDL